MTNPSRRICGLRVDAVDGLTVADRVIDWARAGESRAVCFSTVHMTMEAHDSATFCEIVNRFDIVAPDGMPMVWGLKLQGVRSAQRTYGPDTTRLMIERAAKEHVPVGFYGGSPKVLESWLAQVRDRYPSLQIAYFCSPPFRPLTEAELAQEAEEIKASGVRIIFVGLGCPKQERWIAHHLGQVPAVMMAVGAAFDFLAGSKKQAPRWMMAAGLEWFFRLITEPRRLWFRYLKHNPRFVAQFAMQLIRQKLHSA